MSPRFIEKMAKRFLPLYVRIPIRYLRFRMALGRQVIYDCLHGSQQGGIAVPPPLLRFRVQGGVGDANNFLNVGLNCMQDAISTLRRFGTELHEFRNILDFGCGSGRMMRWMQGLPESVRLTGTDIDKKAVAWCRKHIPFARFDLNEPHPPLIYDSHSFDLILSVSVLNHFDAPYQKEWIQELKRVSAPNGMLLLTFFGTIAQQYLDEADRKRIRSSGALFREDITGFFKPDGLPDFYQSMFQNRKSVVELCSPHFEVLEYVEGGIGNFEDLIILRNSL
ncbi:MAG: class I SAM-dependent methyltransferase [Planctomycetota bacterium]